MAPRLARSISRRCSELRWVDLRLRPRRSFHCRSRLPCDSSGSGRVGRAGGCPTVRAGIVSPAGVQIVEAIDLRPRRSFHCQSRLPCDSLGQWARWSCWWLSNYPCWDCISRRCSNSRWYQYSAPDDHFTAGPHCRVNVSASGRVGGAGGCPTIRAGIVSPAGVQIVAASQSTPDDHFTASPHCRVKSASGRVGRAGGCPTIRAGIVSPAGVQELECVISSTPDDHFTASPHCRVIRLGQWARWSCWWLSNYPCWDCISRRCSKVDAIDLHPRRSFHCQSTLPCDRFGQWARWSCWWLSNYPCWDCISRRCSKDSSLHHPPQTIISLPVHTAV